MTIAETIAVAGFGLFVIFMMFVMIGLIGGAAGPDEGEILDGSVIDDIRHRHNAV